jgi:hypothetical protein
MLWCSSEPTTTQYRSGRNGCFNPLDSFTKRQKLCALRDRDPHFLVGKTTFRTNQEKQSIDFVLAYVFIRLRNAVGFLIDRFGVQYPDAGIVLKRRDSLDTDSWVNAHETIPPALLAGFDNVSI